ncbi:MAG: chorismate mutase [Thermoplasmatota archaeon]
MSDPEVSRLRDEIRSADRDILRLAARRIAFAREIGERKASRGLPIRNFAVEAEVLTAAEAQCAHLGLDPRFGRDLLSVLIGEAVRVQERDRHAASRILRSSHGGERALVVGGSGNMGSWFANFLDSRGYEVAVSDPRGPLEGFDFETDPEARARDGTYPLVVIATPPSIVASVLGDYRDARGLVVEIASLKSPFLPHLRKLIRDGARIASIHPMWGPKAEMLADRNLVVCDVGVPELNRAARALFADTAARIVEVPIDQHDPIMAFTLGLPHALNLAFSGALATSPFTYADLEGFGGPTFQKQAAVAAEVANENRELYYQIQKLNEHTPAMYRQLFGALESLESALEDRAAFARFMGECQTYYDAAGGRRPAATAKPISARASPRVKAGSASARGRRAAPVSGSKRAKGRSP